MLKSGAVLLAVSSALALFVSLLVAIAHTVKVKIKIAFCAVLLNITLWQATIFIADNVTTHLRFWNHLVFLWPTLAVISFLIFLTFLSSQYGDRPLRDKRSLVFGTIFGLSVLVQLVAIVSGSIFTQVVFNPVDNTYIFLRGPMYPLYLVGLGVLLILSLIRQVESLTSKKKSQQERRAFRTIFTTVLIAIMYGVFTNILLPNLVGQEYVSLGLITVDILAIGFALSIVRYQFLDIRTYIFRSLAYVTTLLLLMFTYVGIASLFSSFLLKISLSIGAIIILSVVTLLVAVSFQPLLNRFNRITNKLFFRDYYNPEDVLDSLANLLVGTVDVQTIQAQSKQILENALRPTYFSYILNSQQTKNELVPILEATDLNVITPYELDARHHVTLIRRLKKANIVLAVRLRTKHENIGFMLLGPRRSGSGYSYSDQKLLSLAADQLAIGLQNSLRFQEIQNFASTLEKKVEEATAQLRRTNEKLRQLDQTKDDFISMASHQLRTPLTSVKGYVSMVLDGDAGPVSPLQRKLLNQSYISSQRMVYLISDLLNVSRLRTGKFIIEPVPCNLAKVIDEEIEQLKETAKGRNLELTYQKPPHFPTLMLDETKIRQVIMNFIDNAIYYTPSGGRIAVTLTDKPESVEFTVADNGIGVAKHEQPHLFTKFYRAHNAKRARPDGTGLGLFMAKKVIVAQGGAIIFKSQEGKGSTFGFMFAKKKLASPAPVNEARKG